MASKNHPDTSQDQEKDTGLNIKRKAEKLKQEEQSARFIKAARELSDDESGKEFKKAFGKVMQAKPD